MARLPYGAFARLWGVGFGLLATLLLPGEAHGRPAQDEPPVGINAQLEDRYPDRRSAFPDGVIGLADVTYATPTGFRPLTLDLYLPAKHNALLPVIVFVHGGGWMSGHARHAGAFENWPRALASIAAHGYVIASVNYRLSNEAVSPAAEIDVKSAIAWLRASAQRYFIEKTRFGIWGVSAGGQLAALAGTSCDVAELTPEGMAGRESVCVQAVAAWYGVFDFAPLVADAALTPPVARYLGCIDRSCSEEQVRLASPIRFIDGSDPPFLLVHGARDQVVPVAQSTAFHAALQSASVRSKLLVVDNVDHSLIGPTPDDTRAANLRALKATIDFFDCVLREKVCEHPRRLPGTTRDGPTPADSH